jgi:hypothetical protein
MRIFVSSSFEDLLDYRIAAIRVLRQLGHEVVAMEDFVAATNLSLKTAQDTVTFVSEWLGISITTLLSAEGLKD